MVVVIEDAISLNLEVDLPLLLDLVESLLLDLVESLLLDLVENLLLDLVESLLLVVKEGKSNAEILIFKCYLNYQLFLVLPEMINTCSRYLFLSAFFFLHSFLFLTILSKAHSYTI